MNSQTGQHFDRTDLRIIHPDGDPDALVRTVNLVLALDSEMARVFNSTPSEGTSQLQHERACYVFALKAMADFFKGLGVRDFDRRFYRLALALDDLSRGKADPLLAQSESGD